MTAPAAVTAIAAAAAEAMPAPAEQLDLLPPTRFEPRSEHHAETRGARAARFAEPRTLQAGLCLCSPPPATFRCRTKLGPRERELGWRQRCRPSLWR
jgi:hypothetical protein